jgi:hypothetical protein
MLGFQGRPNPPLPRATLNAGYFYPEAKCLGCKTHHTVRRTFSRRPLSGGDDKAFGGLADAGLANLIRNKRPFTDE